MIIKFACLVGVLLCGPQYFRAQQKPRVLLAVFAHPDDEGVVGPVLAHYAREGVKVYLAIASKGEKRAFPHSGIPPGDQLASVRKQEASCSCLQLGINPPIFFGLNDGAIGMITRPPAQNVQAVANSLEELIGTLSPDVIITFGPDGGVFDDDRCGRQYYVPGFRQHWEGEQHIGARPGADCSCENAVDGGWNIARC
jgi:LmbE family N-acetylglucosaminyl deacetylase